MASPDSSTSDTIRVAIHDNNRMATQLLCAALSQQPRFMVIDIAGKSVIEIAAAEPHVALLGANDVGDPVFDEIQQLHRIRPAVKAILLIDQPARKVVLEAFRAGARGVFCRTRSVDCLVKCIGTVQEGQIWADQTATEFLLEAIREPVPIPLVDAKGNVLLSGREQSVVRGVAEGLTNREIAAQLKLSEHTIKNYIFRIFDKLGVSSRVELILYAVAHLQPRQAVYAGSEKDGEGAAISDGSSEKIAG
jgi:DNA-binding NarL/FixJ family response regulator